MRSRKVIQRSCKVEFRLQRQVYKEICRLSKKRGYKNLSRFFTGLAIMAVQDSRRLVWVVQLANAKPKDQDELVRRMLKWPLSLKAMIKMTRKLDK
jgi:hypothetical protein